MVWIRRKEGAKEMTDTQFLVPCKEETKRMLYRLKWQACARDGREVTYDEVLRELMVCGSAGIVSGRTPVV